MGTSAAAQIEFGPTAIRGLLEFGPFDTKLGLELGLSIWLHRSESSPEEAREALLKLRTVILEVSGLDRLSEPYPLIGRTAERDLVTLAGYLSSLVPRAALASHLNAEALIELALGRV
jgi:hypothetical protein